jgi:hypothetical protein
VPISVIDSASRARYLSQPARRSRHPARPTTLKKFRRTRLSTGGPHVSISGAYSAPLNPKVEATCVAGGELLRRAEAAVAEDRAQFGMDLQEEVPVGAVGFRGMIDDFHHQGRLVASIEMPQRAEVSELDRLIRELDRLIREVDRLIRVAS